MRRRLIGVPILGCVFLAAACGGMPPAAGPVGGRPVAVVQGTAHRPLQLAAALVAAFPDLVLPAEDEPGAVHRWRAFVDSLWQVDSLATERALAILMRPYQAGLGAASFASTEYRRRSGRPEPALAYSPPPADLTNAELVLSAIREAPDAPAQRQVLRFASDAAWLLRSLEADTAHYLAYTRAPSEFWWVHECFEVLREAQRLLQPPYSDSLAAITGALGVGDADRWP